MVGGKIVYDPIGITFSITAVESAGGTPTLRLKCEQNGDITGRTDASTGMSGGFFYIPSASGAPTGTPTPRTGQVPMYFDSLNNHFYIYNGAWKKVLLS